MRGAGAGPLHRSACYAPFGATTSTGQTNTNPFKFTGREDDGTGLYYYRARYCSPGLQRFVSEDPLGLASDDLNLYAYVGNSVTEFVDPLGLGAVSLANGLSIMAFCRMPDSPQGKFPSWMTS